MSKSGRALQRSKFKISRLAISVPLCVLLRTINKRLRVSVHCRSKRFRKPSYGHRAGPTTRASAKFRLIQMPVRVRRQNPHVEAATGNAAKRGGHALRRRRPLPLRRLPCRRRSSGLRGLHKRRLRPKHLHERLISTLLVGISPANSNRANELIVYYDRQSPRNEVVGKALLLSEVQANQPAI